MDISKNTTPSVKLKGVGDSLWVTLDPSQPEDLIQNELTTIFGRLKHLATQARVILDTGESSGPNDVLINKLGDFLKESFGVGYISGPPAKRSHWEQRKRTKDANQSWQHHRSDVLMLAGRVRSGQKVSARKHLLIMGDLNPGSEVTAGGDILIMGSMRGSAAAGQPGNEDAIIVALDFRPTQIQIGGYIAAGIESSPAKAAEIAFVENNAIVVADYLKTNPFGKLPWPEVR